MAPPPLELIDDVTTEILFRLPPDEPEHLVRASAVCKDWLRVVSNPGFLRRYRAFYGAPPLLGLLLHDERSTNPHRFVPTTALPAFLCPGANSVSYYAPMDCRHGRVLFYMGMGKNNGEEEEDNNEYLLVWDPIQGGLHSILVPFVNWMAYSAAVLCATDGCDHLDCHGGPFRVVLIATDFDQHVKASVYSSCMGAWSAPVALAVGIHPDVYVLPWRVTLLEDKVCYTILRDNSIVKYDLNKNCLSMIKPPQPHAHYNTLMEMEDGALGFACIQNCSLYLWSRKANSKGVAEWVQSKVIELAGVIPAAVTDEKARVVGSAEGVGVVFVSSSAGVFTIKLNSGNVKKVDEPGVYYSVLPYMSFYTPDCGALLQQRQGLTDL